MPQQMKKQMELTCLTSIRKVFVLSSLCITESGRIYNRKYPYFKVQIIGIDGNLKKFGEWHKIIVDEQLPLKIFEKKKAHGGFRRGNTFQPEKVEDYWALLLEKVKKRKQK